MPRPVSEVWNEIWHILRPLIETPFSGGPATWMEDIPLEINRSGFLEETHFTIAYSPLRDQSVSGGIGGVLATVHEITEKVVGERRVRALRDLGARSVEPRSAEEHAKHIWIGRRVRSLANYSGSHLYRSHWPVPRIAITWKSGLANCGDRRMERGPIDG